ncbi:MAG TPA: MFS transporter [Candidatus Dormibacteraeota bacterium]|nr:MFS transporter [Candidatus Dormibacteraeota bacterium]
MIGPSMRADRVVLSHTAIAAVGATYLAMGLVVSSYGPLLEHLTRRFGVSLPIAGATISVHFAASLVGVLAAMRSVEKLPGRTTVMIATGLVGIGCVGAALAASWASFMVAIAVIGFGFGALVLSLNQLVAYSEGARRGALLNILNGAYSAGEVVSPVLVALFAAQHFAVLFIGAAILSLVLIPGDTGIVGRLPFAAGPGRPSRLVLIFVLAIVLYVGIENGTGGWMTSHLESLDLGSTQAASVTSGFWLALVTGRVLMSVVPPRIPEPGIVLGGAAVATVALLAASFGPIAPVAYVVAGLFIAPIFPTTIVWLARMRPGDSRATSWLYPAASIGGTFGPGAIGIVVAAFGVRWVPVVLALVAIAMTITFWFADRRSRA